MPFDFDEPLWTPTPEPILDEPNPESHSILDYATDIWSAPYRGLEGAVSSIYNLTANYTNLPSWDDRLLGRSHTGYGGFLEGMYQFLSGFVPVVGWLSKGAKAGHMSRTAQLLGKGSLAGKGVGTRIARDTLAGGIADFAVFDGHEERLSNFLQQYQDYLPDTVNAITNYLQAEEDDSFLEGRLKNVLEGGALGLGTDVIGSFIGAALRKIKHGRAPRAAGDVDGLREVMNEDAEIVLPSIAPDDELPYHGFRSITNDAGQRVHVRDMADGSQMVIRGDGKGHFTLDGEPITGAKTVEEAANKVLEQRGIHAPTEIIDGADLNDVDDMVRGFERELPGIDPTDITPPEKILTDYSKRINVMRMNESPARIVRGFERMLEAGEKFRDVVTNPESVERARLELKNMLNGADPRDVDLLAKQSNIDLELGARQSRRMVAWRVLMHKYSQEMTEFAATWRDAPIADRTRKLAEANIMRAKLYIAIDTVKGMAAHAGRDLQQFRMPYSSFDDAAEALRNTGREGEIENWLDAVTDAVKAGGNDATVVKLAEQTFMSRLGRMTMEWWMNSILSGPRTHAINIISGGMNAVWRPMEKLLGSTVTFNIPGFKQAVREFGDILEGFKVAMKPTAEAIRTGEPVLNKQTKFAATDLDLVNEIQAGKIGAKLPSFVSNTLHYVSLFNKRSFRFLTGEDEFFKQAVFHMEAKSQLRRTFMEQGHTLREASELASDQVEHLTYHGTIASQEILFEKHLASLRETGQFVSTQSMKDEAWKRAQKEWNSAKGVIEQIAKAEGKTAAEEVTFQQALRTREEGGRAIEAMGASMQKFTRDMPILKLFAPFIKTPTNLLMAAQDRSLDPALGMARWLGSFVPGSQLRKAIKAGDGQAVEFLHTNNIRNRFLKDLLGDVELPKGVSRNSPEAKAILAARKQQAMGRLSTAVGTAAFVTWLVSEGRITGAGPADKRRSDIAKKTGFQAYSIKIGDTWYEYKRLDPFSTMLGVYADLYTIARLGGESEENVVTELALTAWVSLANNVANKTYLTGLRKFVSMFDDADVSIPGIAGSFAASMIPADISQIGKWAGGDDPAWREVRSVTDAVVNRLPGFGDNLDKVRNFLGEEVTRTRFLGSGDGPTDNFTSLFLPIAWRETNDDMLYNELDSLKHPFFPPREKKGGVNLREFRSSSGQSAYDRMLELRGEVKLRGRDLKTALRALIRSTPYQRMDPEPPLDGISSPRIQAIKNVIAPYQREAARKMLREFPEVALAQQVARRAKLNAKTGALNIITDR